VDTMAPVHRDHGESKALRGPQARKDLKESLDTLLHSLSL